MQTIPAIDLYRELEVDPAASTETIDAAWKSLLKRHHPDVAADPAAAHERVKRLNLAHEWLADPHRRAMYDGSRRRPGVLMVPRSSADARPRRPGRPPVAGPTAGPGRAQGSQQRDPDGAGHNPYGEDGGPGRGATALTGAGAAPVHEGRSRFPGLVLPVALVSVLVVVAISSYLASTRTSSAVAPTAAGASGGPGSPAVAVASGTSAASQGGILPLPPADPRGLPTPDLAAALPAACSGANVSRAFSFEVVVAGTPAKAFVVRCDGTRSFGPLVYVASVTGWRLTGKGAIHQGYAYQGFSGSITGRSPDEFGIAWTRGDGTNSTITLYRVANGVKAFWDSSSIGLAWSLARFTYQGKPDATAAGYLIVVSADLKTGTPNCATCKDHQLYREFYAWDAARPEPVLRQTAREPYGLGPP